MRQQKNILIISTLFTAIVSTLMIATPVSAQDQEREVVRKKIESLLHQAERLQDEGAGDRAEQLVNQARELEARLNRVMAALALARLPFVEFPFSKRCGGCTFECSAIICLRCLV